MQHKVGRAVDLKLRGVVHKVLVMRTGPHRFRVAVDDDGPLDASLERIDAYASRLTVEGALPPHHRHARAGAARRGGRRDAPGQP